MMMLGQIHDQSTLMFKSASIQTEYLNIICFEMFLGINIANIPFSVTFRDQKSRKRSNWPNENSENFKRQ